MSRRLRLADGQPPWARWVFNEKSRGCRETMSVKLPGGTRVVVHDARLRYRMCENCPPDLPDGFVAEWWGSDGVVHVSADVSMWMVRVRSSHPSRPVQDEASKLREAGINVLGYLSESMELDVQVPDSDALDRLFDAWLPFTVDPRGP